MSTTEESVPLPSITERIQLRVQEVRDSAKQGLRTALKSVGMEPERGPADYDAFSDERRFYQRLLKEQRGGSYNNGDGGSNAWQKWLVTLCGGLALMGIGGGIVMYGKLSAIEANQVSQQRQLDQLAGQVATLRRSP